jgi:hypothetical protein
MARAWQSGGLTTRRAESDTATPSSAELHEAADEPSESISTLTTAIDPLDVNASGENENERRASKPAHRVTPKNSSRAVELKGRRIQWGIYRGR